MDEADSGETLSDLQDLLKSRGWGRLCNLAEAQVRLRRDRALGPATDLLRVLTQEFEKGEISGIQLFMQLPGIAVEQLTKDRNDDATREEVPEA